MRTIVLATILLAGCATSPRYYIVNFTDASVIGTSKAAEADQLARSDEFLVIDAEKCERLTESGTRERLHCPQ